MQSNYRQVMCFLLYFIFKNIINIFFTLILSTLVPSIFQDMLPSPDVPCLPLLSFVHICYLCIPDIQNAFWGNKTKITQKKPPVSLSDITLEDEEFSGRKLYWIYPIPYFFCKLKKNNIKRIIYFRKWDIK